MRGTDVLARLNIAIQVIGIIAGIYLMFSDSFIRGVIILVIVAGGHYAFTALSKALMYLHQRTMQEDEIAELALAERLSGDTAAIPLAWKVIAWVCGICYFSIAAYSVWFFLAR